MHSRLKWLVDNRTPVGGWQETEGILAGSVKAFQCVCSTPNLVCIYFQEVNAQENSVSCFWQQGKWPQESMDIAMQTSVNKEIFQNIWGRGNRIKGKFALVQLIFEIYADFS